MRAWFLQDGEPAREGDYDGSNVRGDGLSCNKSGIDRDEYDSDGMKSTTYGYPENLHRCSLWQAADAISVQCPLRQLIHHMSIDERMYQSAHTYYFIPAMALSSAVCYLLRANTLYFLHHRECISTMDCCQCVYMTKLIMIDHRARKAASGR